MSKARLTTAQYELLEILVRRDHTCLASYRPGKALIAQGFASSCWSGTSLGSSARTLRITDAGLVFMGAPSRSPKTEESAS